MVNASTFMEKFWMQLAGIPWEPKYVDRDTYSVDLKRGSTYGRAILIPMIIWFISGFFIVKQFGGNINTWSGLATMFGAGIAAALFIRLLDTTIINSSKHWSQSLTRLVLGFVIAFIGSFLIDSVLFESEINDRITQKIEAEYEFEPSGDIKVLEEYLVVLNSDLEQANISAESARQKIDNDGSTFKTAVDAWNTQVAKIDQAFEQAQAQYKTDRAEVKNQIDQITSDLDKLNAAIANKNWTTAQTIIGTKADGAWGPASKAKAVEWTASKEQERKSRQAAYDTIPVPTRSDNPPYPSESGKGQDQLLAANQVVSDVKEKINETNTKLAELKSADTVRSETELQEEIEDALTSTGILDRTQMLKEFVLDKDENGKYKNSGALFLFALIFLLLTIGELFVIIAKFGDNVTPIDSKEDEKSYDIAIAKIEAKKKVKELEIEVAKGKAIESLQPKELSAAEKRFIMMGGKL